MSKVLWILWQSLKVTPAILLATLLVSANAVRAAQSKGQLTVENGANNIGAQPQTDVESSPAKSLQKPEVKQEVISAVPSVATPVAPATANAPAFSKSAADLQSPITAEVKSLTEVAVKSSPQLSVEPETAPAVEMSKSAAATTVLPAKPTVAAPATSSLATAPVENSVALPAMPEAAPKVAKETPTTAATKSNVVVPAMLEVAPKVAKETPTTAATKSNVVVPAMPEAAPKVAQAVDGATSDSDTLRQINRYSNEGRNNNESIDQVTNVSQFSDVRPGDWAYEALRELVERYGCIAGYPDSTYRGNRALTRYEFAAGLRACLNQIEKLIAASTSDFATKDDLEKLRRLVQEFQAELATLGTRVDKLEGRVGFLENHQFSTTTKLVGEGIFAVSDPIRTRGGNSVAPTAAPNAFRSTSTNDKNTVFGDRIRLEFQTSFTGQDILHTRLSAGNLRPFNLGLSDRSNNNSGAFAFNGTTINTPQGQQTFNYTGTNNFGNAVNLDWLAYEFPFYSSKIYIAATGGLHSDYAPVLNPYFYDGDGGNGSLSLFSQESPIYRIGGGAGAGVRFGLGKIGVLGPTSLTFGYLAGNANSPLRTSGLTGGDYGALGQVNFNILDRIGIGLTYVNAYHTSGSGIYNVGLLGQPIVGTSLANNPALLSYQNLNNGNAGSNTALTQGRMITNSYGAEAAFRLTDRISISGFGLRTNVRVLGAGGGDGQIWSYGGGLAFPDLGKKGSVLGLFAGIEPTLRGYHASVGGTPAFSRDNGYHLEGFYKYQLTDNISITPGVIWLTHPNQDTRNQNDLVGTLRTTFTF
jgi:hypothetical protein